MVSLVPMGEAVAPARNAGVAGRAGAVAAGPGAAMQERVTPTEENILNLMVNLFKRTNLLAYYLCSIINLCVL
jgi:hypothetical protein